MRKIKNPTGVSERKPPKVDQHIPGKSVGFNIILISEPFQSSQVQ